MTFDKKQQAILDNLLIEAVGNKDVARAQVYVAKGASVDVPVNTSQTLYQYGQAYRTEGSAPLYHDMYERVFSYEMSDFLFSQGVSVDVKNFKGNTPLMLAVKNGYLSYVKYFLSKGADPLATNASGEVVLEEARRLPASVDARQTIIDVLVDALGAPVKPLATPVAAANAKGDDVETSRDIQPLKPIEFAGRKKNAGGFNL